jgi:Protein of unknown function (DUF3800)
MNQPRGGRSFGGAPLRGDKIVRIVHLDEAGISNRQQEPILVVAGVIIEPDRNWRDLEAYYAAIVHDLFPENEEPWRFVFQAKEVWHGSGPFDRKKWNLPTRIQIMRRLAQVPRLFNLPVVIGSVARQELRDELRRKNPNIPEKTIRIWGHALAFLEAIQRVEHWMAQNASDEMTMLISEDTAEIKSAIELLHEGYTDGDIVADAFQAPHIIGAPLFAKKRDSRLLQIADHCAFICKRKLMKKSDIEPLYLMIAQQISWNYKPARKVKITLRAKALSSKTRR